MMLIAIISSTTDYYAKRMATDLFHHHCQLRPLTRWLRLI
jgi:hypothetical protein